MVFVTILSIRIASNGCRKRPTQRSVRARHRYSNFVGGWIVDTLQRAIMMSVFPTKAAMEKTKFILERNIDNPGVNVLVWFTMVCSSLQLTVLQFSYARSVFCAVRKSSKILLGWHLFTGLIAEPFTYTPINTQNYVYHMDAPASISSECLVLLWYVRYSWPSSNYERRTCTTSVITVKALGIVWRESKNMADGAKTHLAFICLRRTLRYSDRRRHT